MAEEKKPEPFPPPVEEDEEEDEPKSTLPPEVAEREAEEAIREIEEEIEEEHPVRPPAPPPARHAEGEPTFIDRAWERQYALEGRLKRIGHGRYSRVVRMARKPEHEEFVRASQITGMGIFAVGLIGFLIYLFMQWLMTLLGVK